MILHYPSCRLDWQGEGREGERSVGEKRRGEGAFFQC